MVYGTFAVCSETRQSISGRRIHTRDSAGARKLPLASSQIPLNSTVWDEFERNFFQCPPKQKITNGGVSEEQDSCRNSSEFLRCGWIWKRKPPTFSDVEYFRAGAWQLLPPNHILLCNQKTLLECVFSCFLFVTFVSYFLSYMLIKMPRPGFI